MEVIFLMPLTDSICFSSGRVTKFSISTGGFPGYMV